MIPTRLLAFLLAVCPPLLFGDLSFRLMPADPDARAESEFEVWLLVSNSGRDVMPVISPYTITATLGGESLRLKRNEAAETGQIAPGESLRVSYSGSVPTGVEGIVSLFATDIETGRCFLEVTPPVGDPTSGPLESDVPTVPLDPPGDRARFADNLSFYEPVYFVVGPSGSTNAKFQLGFKYRMLTAEGSLSSDRPVWAHLFFGYTQTSIWDIGAESAPFRDTSYKPGVFYFDQYRDLRFLGGELVSLEGGYQHESNGKDGEASRSLNILYIRPTLRYGSVDGWHLTVAPKVWTYISDLSDNPDIAEYRGYFDLNLRYGKPDSWEIATTLRKGVASGYGSVQIDATYPLDVLFFKNAASYIHFQYFNGWGETLFDYNRRGPNQYRIGFSLYR